MAANNEPSTPGASAPGAATPQPPPPQPPPPPPPTGNRSAAPTEAAQQAPVDGYPSAQNTTTGYPPPPPAQTEPATAYPSAPAARASAPVARASDPEAQPTPSPAATVTNERPLTPRQALAVTCRQELETNPEAARVGRLHYELARLSDTAQTAMQHYQSALSALPDHLPSIRGARRSMLSSGDVTNAAALYDQEIRLTQAAPPKARLWFDKGRALEDVGHDLEGAIECFRRAVELDATTPAYLNALAQCQRHTEDWKSLAATHEKTANAVAADPRHKSAMMAERAKLLELRLDNAPQATELYEQALALDETATGPMAALKRLHEQQERWGDLISILEREAAMTSDAAVRTSALYRAGRIHGEKLGNRDQGIGALARAMQVSPRDLLVLETLARLYEIAVQPQSVAHVLAHRVEATGDARERLGLLQRVAEIHEKELKSDEAAQPWYEAALQIDPTYRPAINALDTLYERRQAWQALIVMYLATAEALSDSVRVAACHTRIAEVFEIHVRRIDEAIRHYQRALALDQAHEGAFKALTRLYAQVGNHRELIELHERAIERNEQVDVKIAYLLKIGSLFEDALRESEQAVHAYQRVLQLQPDHLGGLHALQRAAARSGRHRELHDALVREEQLTEDVSRKAALLHRAAELQTRSLNDDNAALLMFRQVLELDPDHLASVTSLANLYHKLGRWDDLLEIREIELTLTKQESNGVELLYKMATTAEYQLGDNDRAIALCRRAIAVDPAHGPSLRALAFQLRRREDYKALVGVLQSEVVGAKTMADKAIASFRLGEIYELRLQQPEPAATAYAEAVASAPGYTPAVDALTRVRGQLSKWSEVADDLASQAQTSGDHRIAIEALLRAGEIWADLQNQPVRAVASYESVRALQADNLPALIALEQLYREAEQWEHLAEVLSTQAGVLQSPKAQLGALEELARLLATERVDNPTELRRAYTAIIAIDGAHPGALFGLEQLAIQTQDPALLADVDSRYARSVTDNALHGAHCVRLGELLEANNPAGALVSFRSALEKDPDNVAAMRGLGRSAEQVGDAGAMIAAARLEANWTRVDPSAAALLVRSARIHLERLGSAEGAAEDAKTALERSADNAEAAALVERLLRASGDVDKLISLLSHAAGQASDDGRIAALWCSVARLYADLKGDLGAALAAVDRVLKDKRDDAATMHLLGDLQLRNGQSEKAAGAYRKALLREPPAKQRVEILYQLATLYTEPLDNPAEAIAALEQLLRIDTQHRAALTRLLKLHKKTKNVDACAEVAKRLVETAPDHSSRLQALCELGDQELHRGQRRQAAAAFREAVALEGPSGKAAEQYQGLLGTDEPWERYTEALTRHLRSIQAGEIPRGDLRPTYMALARGYHDMLGRVDDAVATLRAGLQTCDGHLEIHIDLANRLSSAKRSDEAITEYRRIVATAPSTTAAWRGMGRTLLEAGHKLEAGVAFAPLVVFGEADDLEAGLSRQKRILPGWVGEGSFNNTALQTLSVAERWDDSRICVVLQSMGEAFAKLFPLEQERYSVSKSDRLSDRSDHPVRAACDRLAAACDIEDYEVYLHAAAAKDVVVELSTPPSIMVPKSVAELPEAQMVFLLARAFANLARGVHSVVTLGLREVDRLVTATLRTVAPGYGVDRYNDEDLRNLHKRIHKALSRRGRRNVETACSQYFSDRPPDLASWYTTVPTTAARAAALMANDLPDTLKALQYVGVIPAGMDGRALARSAPSVSDLLRFWPSDLAFERRRSAGII